MITSINEVNMKTEHKMIDNQNSQHIVANHPQEQNRIGDLITQSWGTIAPTWPLKNLIAANPLAGLEDLTFEEAVRNGQAYFQQRELPAAMHNVNRETIKWLQAFFDEGQATIKMPARQLGLYAAVKQLLRFDWRVTGVHSKTSKWLKNIPDDPKHVIAECLLFLGVESQKQGQFLTLLLTTLSGWAAYVKYRTDWPDVQDIHHPHPVTQADYLALRLIITCLIWPEAKALLEWHEQAFAQSDVAGVIAKIYADEEAYRTNLLSSFSPVQDEEQTRADAQILISP